MPSPLFPATPSPHDIYVVWRLRFFAQKWVKCGRTHRRLPALGRLYHEVSRYKTGEDNRMVGGQCWLVGASGGYANVPGPGGVGVTPSGRSLVGCKPRGVMTILVFILHRDGRVALKFFSSLHFLRRNSSRAPRELVKKANSARLRGGR